MNRSNIIKKSGSKFLHNDMRDWGSHTENDDFKLLLLKLLYKLLNDSSLYSFSLDSMYSYEKHAQMSYHLTQNIVQHRLIKSLKSSSNVHPTAKTRNPHRFEWRRLCVQQQCRSVWVHEPANSINRAFWDILQWCYLNNATTCFLWLKAWDFLRLHFLVNAPVLLEQHGCSCDRFLIIMSARL